MVRMSSFQGLAVVLEGQFRKHTCCDTIAPIGLIIQWLFGLHTDL